MKLLIGNKGDNSVSAEGEQINPGEIKTIEVQGSCYIEELGVDVATVSAEEVAVISSAIEAEGQSAPAQDSPAAGSEG